MMRIAIVFDDHQEKARTPRRQCSNMTLARSTCGCTPSMLTLDTLDPLCVSSMIAVDARCTHRREGEALALNG